MKHIFHSIRQGDVHPIPLVLLGETLPKGCTEVPLDRGRIVLAYGEVTGHAHAIADHTERTSSPGAADEITEAVIARAQTKARLLVAPNGERYLEVTSPVTLRHEEHTAHVLAATVYKLPQQVEYSPAELRRVED